MKQSLENILVIKLGALGDFIQALGPMAAIRKHHPQAHITLLTTEPFRDFATESGYFTDIWIDQKPRWNEIKEWLDLRKRLNSASFTRVYDLQNNDRTAFYLKLFSKKPEWVGAAKGASHRNTSKKRTAGHAFDGHVQTLALSGINNISIDKMEWLKADVSDFPLRRPYVLLVPGSAPGRLEKRWPAKHYARIAEVLSQWGYQTVILGTASETGLASIIAGDSPDILDLTGRTSLAQIGVISRHAAAAIGNDTGPMHLIAATGCTCLALFSGASDAVRHAPKGDHVIVLKSQNLQNLKTEKVLQLFKTREEPPLRSARIH